MNNERKSFYRSFLPMFLAFLLPFVIIGVIAFAAPAVYNDTFEGELADKYDRLYAQNEPKIVIIAGSSAAYGLDSELMERELGYKVVNFGLYGNLGTKLMIDLSRDALGEGDIVVLATEISEWTLSLGFSPKTTAEAFDGRFDMARHLRGDDRSSIIGGLWSFSANKLYYTLRGTRPENAAMYQKSYFNKYGDSEFPRQYNIMNGYNNPIKFSCFFDESYTAENGFSAFIDYVNEYTAFAEKHGAQVYYSFPPMDELSVALGAEDSEIDKFYTRLCLALDCRVISNIHDYILDDGYFYDSEFHLNDSGVVVRTVQLIDDIKRELGRDDVTMRFYELPAPSGYRPDCVELELQKTADGSGWTVVSLSEEGRELRAVTIPDTVSGLPVVDISSGAFKNCESLVTLTLGRNVRTVANGAIEYCPNLSGLIIPEGVKPANIELPENFLGYGCADDFKIYVSPTDYDDYISSDIPKIVKYQSIIAKNENFIYRTENGSAIVTGLSESGKLCTQLSIPDEYNGLPVTEIDENSFDGAAYLEQITLGKNVRTLSDGCLSGLGDVTLRLAKGVSADAYADMPAGFGESGQLTIIADWQLYGDYLESPAFAACRDALTCENEFLELADSGEFWTVIGVNERANGVASLTIPDIVDGKPVSTIAENAFAECGAESLTIGKNVQRLDGGALRGSSITELIIPDGVAADQISVPNNMSECLATDGCRDGLKITVQAELYEGYVSDYFWGDYAKFLVPRG